MISNSDYDIRAIISTFAFVAIAIFLTFGLLSKIKAEPDVRYRAIITDFNVVYEQGYQIISRDGKIYTLEKVKE